MLAIKNFTNLLALSYRQILFYTVKIYFDNSSQSFKIKLRCFFQFLPYIFSFLPLLHIINSVKFLKLIKVFQYFSFCYYKLHIIAYFLLLK